MRAFVCAAVIMQKLCDPQLDENYVQHDPDGSIAVGDINAMRARLPPDSIDTEHNYMMSPFVDASVSVVSYTPMWELLRWDNHELNISSSMRNYKWLLYDTQITKKRNVGLECTHLSLNDGKFHIPRVSLDAKKTRNNEETFLKYYALARLQGQIQYFIETRTPVFRYYMDLDFKQPAEIPPRSMEIVAFVILRTIRKFWPERPETDDFFRCIVSTTNYKKEPAKPGAETSTKVKTGVHLIWPFIFLSDVMALDIRESVIADLQNTFGPRTEPAMNNWSDVVDLSVYKGSGLRMIGSNKTEACHACNRKGTDEKGELCGSCGGQRKVDAGRPYMPLLVLNGAGRRDLEKEAQYLKDFHAVVLDSSIRCHDTQVPDTGYRIPDGAPTYESNQAHSKKSGHGRPGIAAEFGAAARFGNKNRLDLTTKESTAMQDFIRCQMGGGTIYTTIGVQSVLCIGKKSKYLVNVQGVNSTFCQNIGRCHRSNRAYFEFTTEGCVQRCHDQSETIEKDMKFGLCKDYKSANVRLTAELMSVLFPETAAKNELMDFVPQNDTFGDSMASVQELSDLKTLDMRLDVKMRSLLAAGDQLSMELHGMEWSSTVTLPSGGSFRELRMQRLSQQSTATQIFFSSASRGIPMYAEINPSAIGSRAESALKLLGFTASSKANEAVAADGDYGSNGENGKRLTAAQKSPASSKRRQLDVLEVSLWRQLKNAVQISLTLDLDTASRALSGSDSLESLLNIQRGERSERGERGERPDSLGRLERVETVSGGVSSKLRFE